MASHKAPALRIIEPQAKLPPPFIPNVEQPARHAKAELSDWAEFVAGVVAFIGLAGIAGWLFNIPLLAQGLKASVLIAPRSALLFLFTGAVLAVYARAPERLSGRLLLALAAIVSWGFVLFNEYALPLATQWFEPMLLRNINTWEYVYRDRMPPLDAGTFFVFGLMFLYFAMRQGRWKASADVAGGVMLLVLLVHSLVVLGYTYGAPFLYPEGYKPSSVLSSLGFALLASAATALLGAQAIPLRPLWGPSVRARLLRTFLPIGLCSILFYSILFHTVFRFLNPTLTSFWSAFLIVLIFGFWIVRSSHAVSHQVEHAVRESEHRFGVLVDNLKDHAIFMLDAEGHVTSWNDGAERLQGFRANEILEEPYDKFYTEADRVAGKPQTALKEANRLGSFIEEGWRYRKSGELFWAEAQVTPLVDELKTLKGYSVIVRDITERRKAEAEREQAEARVRASLREKEVMLKEIHHRVKNNLQIISSLLRLQSESVGEQPVLQMFQESEDRVQSMALIHEYLYQSEDLAHIQFSDYLRNLVSSLARSYGVAPDGVQFVVEVDETSLNLDQAIPCGLIVTELVTNALKYAFPEGFKGERLIAVEFRLTSPKAYELMVKDAGVGLPESIDPGTSDSLGLRLVQALTDQLKGLVVIGRKGGTEFRIAFKEA